VNRRRAGLVTFGALMLLAGGVLAQVKGWPPFWPHGTRVQSAALYAYASEPYAGYSTPQDILTRYPRLGTPRNQWDENGKTRNLLYLPAGSNGVVRNLWFAGIDSLSGYTDLDNYELRIYVGPVAEADTLAPPSEYLSAQIPLGLLCGTVYDVERGNATVTTPLLDYQSNTGGTFKVFSIQLNTPIPFQNGVLLQIWERDPVRPVIATWKWCTYDVGTTTFPYQTWRLKAATYRGILSYTDPYATFMDVASGSGILLGLWASIRATPDGPSRNTDFLEGNWMLLPDGETSATWQTSGCEDLFGTNCCYFSGGEQVHDGWGLTYFDADTARFEGYRTFVRDPIMWTDGIVGRWQNYLYSADSADTDVTDVNITTLYYGSQ
jgi:hypothetical protein